VKTGRALDMLRHPVMSLGHVEGFVEFREKEEEAGTRREQKPSPQHVRDLSHKQFSLLAASPQDSLMVFLSHS
jgi:hypothetical protein